MQKGNLILEKAKPFLNWWKSFSSRNRKFLFFLKLIFSALFVFLAFKKINISVLPELLKNINLTFAIVSLLITFLVSLIFVARIYILFKGKEEISFIQQYFINRAGNFFNFFLFGNLGQELSRIKYYRTSKKDTILVSFIDRILGALSLITILIFFNKPLSEMLGIKQGFVLLLILVALCFSIFIIIYLARKTNTMAIQIINAFIVSMFYSIGLIFISFFVFKTLGVNNIFFNLFWVIPTLSILLMLPISVNGIGLRELFLISVLPIDSNLVIAYSLLDYIIFILLALPGVIYFLCATRGSCYQKQAS